MSQRREQADWGRRPPRRARPQHVYRGSRAVSPARLAIPIVLLAASAAVIGAAFAAYVGTSSHDAAPGTGKRRATSHATSGRVTSAARPAPTSAGRPSRATSGPASGAATAPPAASRATGHGLNDQGYALIQRGRYSAAVAPLQQAVRDLRGAGPSDPYEAFANYNLGYALLRSGACGAAVIPLTRANQLETSPLVDRGLTQARACAPHGS